MRLPFASSLIIAAVAAIALSAGSVRAQGQPQHLPAPPSGFKPPPAAPVKPYKPLPITLPAPYNDPSFAAFHKQLAQIVQRKDRAALAKLVTAQGFFWMQDKDVADKRKSGMANLAKAVDLNGKGGYGWELLAGMAEDPTAEPLADRRGVVCGPADPSIDQKALEALTRSTGTQPAEWGYPATDGVEVRSTVKPNAPVIDKLGMYLVRVLPDNAPQQNANQPTAVHVALPSGKTGFVAPDAISPIGGDQLCYSKDASGGWKIVGYLGGASE